MQRNIETRSYHQCYSLKVIDIVYSECVFGLSYPACKALARYYLLCPVRLLQYLTTLFHKRNDFKEIYIHY